MARGVQYVDAASAVIELKHGAGDRDSSLLLNLHPVRDCMPGGCLSLHGTRQIDCASVQQELLRQCCLSRIRMRDNRECPSFFDFLFDICHVRVSIVMCSRQPQTT